MNLELKIVDSLEVRLVIQIISFLIALIVTQMVWREYIRNKDKFLQLLTASFSVLFVQSAFMLAVFIYSMVTKQKLPEVFMPMVDHVLKVVGYLTLSYSFAVVANTDKVKSTKVFRWNCLALILSTPVFWYLWHAYLLQAPLNQQKFGFFWIDPVYEIWNMGLLIWGMYLVGIANVKMRCSFLIAFSIIFLKQVMHLTNVLASNNTIPFMLVVERLLLVPYFYVIIMAIHREIVDEVLEVNQEKVALNRKMYDSTIQALVSSLEIKDYYTRGHAKRVTKYCQRLGQAMGFSEEQLTDLYYGAVLHDIGKIGVHEGILNKPEGLAWPERKAIEKHPENGANVVGSLDNLRHIVPTILHHHERWDGTGYPKGLRGEQIPLNARVVAVADAYDAMTTDRAYRTALTHEQAVQELKDGRGKQFDPEIVDLFLDILREESIVCPEPSYLEAAATWES